MDQTQIDEFLLHCLRTSPDTAGERTLEPLSEADWEALLQQSARHRITPLLYHRLRTSHPHIPIPPSVVGRLRQAHLDNSARALRLYNNLRAVLEVLRRDGIPVVVLKGAHLAELVYGSRALRFMGDLDLLVQKGDLTRVDARLLEMGCTTRARSRIVGKENNEFAYVMPKRDVCLEIHWSIVSPRFPLTIDTDGLWERARPAIIAGVEAAVLCPEDLLLHLCVHAGCAHGYEPGLGLLCDIGEVLRHDGGGMDWGLVQRRAREWGMGKCVYLTLKLSRDLLGVALPEGLMEALKPSDSDERYVALAKDQIFARRARTKPSVSVWPAGARFWGAARLRDKVVLFARFFFVPREAMALLYPAPPNSMRIYFYYVVRLRDLLRMHGPDVWRWLKRDEEMRALAKAGGDLTALKDWLMSS